MSVTSPAMTPEERQALAGEYVLGVLDDAAMEACEARLRSDAFFAAAVEDWRRRFAEIDMAAEPVAPPEALWPRITGSIATRPPAPAASRATASSAPGRWAQWWDSLTLWRGVGLAAAAAVLLLAVGLAVQMRQLSRTPVLVAVLVSDANRPAAIVNTFRDGRAELVPLEAIVAPEGRSLQVWTLWDRARGPVSVGLLDAMRSLDLRLDGLPGTVPEQLFEVTLEPAGGSPTGRPTGPILMKGTASRAL